MPYAHKMFSDTNEKRTHQERALWKCSQPRSCTYCGCSLKHVPRQTRTVDHIIPLSRGGVDDPSNWAMCCLVCNQKKGTMTGDEFRAARKRWREETKAKEARNG